MLVKFVNSGQNMYIFSARDYDVTR